MAGTRNASVIGQIRAGPASPPESEDRIQQQSSTSAAQDPKPLRQRANRRDAGEDSSVANHAKKVGPENDDSGNEVNLETGRWLNGATKATAVSNIPSSQEHDSTRFLGHGDDRRANTGLEEEPAIDWWQLLNPWTYVKATAWMVEATGQRLVDLYSSVVSASLRRHILSATQILPRIVAGVLTLVLVLALLSAGMARFKADAVDDLWSPVARGTPWYSLGGVARKIRSSLPTLSWSSRNRWDDIVASWETDDPRHSDIDDYLQKIEQAFRLLTEAGRLHDASLEKLEAVVPKVVHMQLKDGKPVVAPEFWHALRDLIHEDGSFLTFNRKGGDYEMSSERQWKAIAMRLVGDAAFTNKLNISIGKVESKLVDRLTLWETWVRENDAKVKQSLGSALDQIKSAGSQREWDERLGKTVKEQIKEYEHQGRFVGRDEYLRLVQSEVSSHLSEFRAELAELQPQLEKLVRESIDLAKGDTPPGMSGAEVTALVNGLLRKAFADINLEALARGKIHAHWDTELRNQVNYFSPAAGATVDAKHSSATYDPFSKTYSTLKAHRKGLRARNPHIAALQPWHDDGDCWCAARSCNHRGNPHGASLAVQLAYRVVPQHLVVEHILPGATTEPGARPREIELYAAIDDAVVRERVRDFAAAHLPTSADGEDSVDGWNYKPADLPERFVMVGRFVYAGAELHGGVHVHRLSSELVALGADTDHVVVRAVSNHGAVNHTCFYRVRLYGHNVELGDGDDELAGGEGGWQ
ncbi:spindle pole body-associated protein sad1 [Hirsutella rhossiliensis]|uniref:Spindle pole body-associated protein sad1 n=1 Tax=Hirsutella rhossiliensis TaxID=111463 RepID=A0A9P8MSB7_9HYPO|nr:spindle pole body-associated protein sad1 [Hirsutella rhossiliensis]KAH0961058.1 spindle pole body-associated protein sad1 [Hirsutella rhossiliensis]